MERKHAGKKSGKSAVSTDRAKTDRKNSGTEVTLTVAECGEFHSLGKYYEGIATVDEAVSLWRQIPPERMSFIPAIGIRIHKKGDEPYQDVEMDIVTGNRIDCEMLEFYPEIMENPQVMDAIAELLAKLPEMEAEGAMPKGLKDGIRKWKGTA